VQTRAEALSANATLPAAPQLPSGRQSVQNRRIFASIAEFEQELSVSVGTVYRAAWCLEKSLRKTPLQGTETECPRTHEPRPTKSSGTRESHGGEHKDVTLHRGAKHPGERENRKTALPARRGYLQPLRSHRMARDFVV